MTSEEPTALGLTESQLPTDRELLSTGALARLQLIFNAWPFILSYYSVTMFVPRWQRESPEFNTIPLLIWSTLLMEVAALNGLLILTLRRRLVRCRKAFRNPCEISTEERTALTVRTDDRDLRIIWLTGLINNGVMAALVLGIAGRQAFRGEITSQGMLIGAVLVVLCAALTTVLLRTQLRYLRSYGIALKACGSEAGPVS